MKVSELFEDFKTGELSVKDRFGDFPDSTDSSFRLDDMELTSLEGSPRYVGGHFSCATNKLTTLEGGPEEVGIDFNCNKNLLTSLKGGPKIVGDEYSCQHNPLISLEGAPEDIKGSFDCSNTHEPGFSLKGAPKRVGQDFFCCHTTVSSLEGMPSFIGRTLSFYNSKLTSLHNIHKHVKHIGGHAEFQQNPIKTHVLGLLLIDGLTEVLLDKRYVEDIINKHLKGERDVFACQEELIENGFEAFAQL